MEELEPGRGWLLNGAQFIKTQKGRDYSVSNLTKIVESLERDGHTPSLPLPIFLFRKETTALALFA